jgi:SAM-dependent methyltransferase
MHRMSNDPSQAAPGRKTVLNVGCGAETAHPIHPMFRTPQWRQIRLDIDAGAKPDIVADMIDMWMVEADSVDAVHSSHNLEHLFAHEVPRALREFYRVLKPGGLLLLAVPDLMAIAEAVVAGKLEQPIYTSPAGPICAVDSLYGHRGWIARGQVFMAHKTGFTAETIAQKLAAAGYARVKATREPEHFNLWAIGYKPS